MLREIISHIPNEVRRPLKHAIAGIAVSLAVLVPGALWYKSSMMSMVHASTTENVAMLKARLMTLRQQMVTEAIIAAPGAWNSEQARGPSRLRRDLPFDMAVVFDSKRKLVDGFRGLTGRKDVVDLGHEAVRRLVPADTAFFDQVASTSAASGILRVDERAMLVAVTRVTASRSSESNGYLVLGRWLDPRRLAGSGEQGESKIEIFDLSNESRMPHDVRSSISPAQAGKGYHWALSQNSGGFLYALLDDIGGRPAFVAKVPWGFSWRNNGQLGFRIFFITSVLAGAATWGILYLGYRRDRTRVRRFDGLESLKDEHIRTLVEAFPGYAFAVRNNLNYIGVSRILAGVTGQEPSYFYDQPFGSIASEWNDGSLRRTFTDLRDPARWPRVANVSHVVEGLGERHVFQGTAHYLSKQDLMLVILTQKENSGSIGLPESPVLMRKSTERKAG